MIKKVAITAVGLILASSLALPAFAASAQKKPTAPRQGASQAKKSVVKPAPKVKASKAKVRGSRR